MSEFSFHKEERLTGRDAISKLFQDGKSIVSPPLRILYELKPAGKFPAKAGIAVPRKLYKRAVDRNRLKRMIRESYRQFKPEFYQILNRKEIKVNLMIIYQSDIIADYQKINNALIKGIKELSLKLLK